MDTSTQGLEDYIKKSQETIYNFDKIGTNKKRQKLENRNGKENFFVDISSDKLKKSQKKEKKRETSREKLYHFK